MHFLSTLLTRYFWLFPFITFAGGYYLVAHWYGVATLPTPSVVGHSLQDAITILSRHNLNARVLKVQQEADAAPGTVMSQTPLPHTKIRPQQSIFLVVACEPTKKVPHCLGNRIDTIQAMAQRSGIRIKSYYLDAPYPTNTCFAQSPAPEHDLSDKANMIVYCAHGTPKPVIMPNFKDKNVHEVMNRMEPHGIVTKVVHQKPREEFHRCDERCVVIDQRPLAGSFVTLDGNKPLELVLQVP